MEYANTNEYLGLIKVNFECVYDFEFDYDICIGGVYFLYSPIYVSIIEFF